MRNRARNWTNPKVSETADSFSSPSFEDVATGLNPEQTGLDKPTRVEIKTFDGFDYSMNVGHEDERQLLSDRPHIRHVAQGTGAGQRRETRTAGGCG